MLEVPDPLLTVNEVAARFRVNRRTITNWVRQKKISATKTPGGHYRFRLSEVEKLLGLKGA